MHITPEIIARFIDEDGIINEGKCPFCSADGAHVGLRTIECLNSKCEKFSPEWVKDSNINLDKNEKVESPAQQPTAQAIPTAQANNKHCQTCTCSNNTNKIDGPSSGFKIDPVKLKKVLPSLGGVQKKVLEQYFNVDTGVKDWNAVKIAPPELDRYWREFLMTGKWPAGRMQLRAIIQKMQSRIGA